MNENSNPNPAEQLTGESSAINMSQLPEFANQPAVYVIFDKSDLENAAKVEERVIEAGCMLFSSRDYLEPSPNGNFEADAAALHREYLAQCDGVIIYWNEAPLIWLRKNIGDLLAAKAQREEKIFIQTVFCEGESELKTKFHSASEMPVLNDYVELSDLLARLWCKHIKPYPGLRPFEYKENYLFFGREGKAQEIAMRLQESNFVAVVGTSGSGKSSVVRAGLLPLLYGGLLYKSGSNWRISIMRPEETPIRNLAESLVYPVDFESEGSSPIVRDDTRVGITEAILRRSGVGLLDFINNPVNKFTKDENLLIVVDQFEELFRFKGKSAGGYSEEAAAFVKLLLEAARDEESRIFVVMTMRSDFLGDCAEFQGLPEAINKGQYLIPQMTRDQLRESIESPALVGGAEVSPALVNRILNDLDDDQSRTLNARDRMVRDYLPVMQHALMRTWDCWKKKGDLNKPISIEHYEEIGGIKSALSKHADEAYGELTEKQKFIAEKMFKCLTETDTENREIRRPARIEEIRDIIGANEQEIFDVIEVFRREGRTFLMPSFNVPLTKNTKIDISHESLIRNWETLKGWVRTEAESSWIFLRISSDARLLTKYREGNAGILSAEDIERNSKDFLWRGIELKDALNWRDTFKPNVAWTSRYQRLTEREKQELANLARTAPEQETEKRKEFMQRHFDEMQEFLSAAALFEAEEHARRERYQQAQLALEREKALNAEQLAKAEQEKVEGLRNLTESLRRQKKVLIAVSAFSLFLMLAASYLAIFAFSARATAKAEQKKADEQKAIAQANEYEAKEQSERALIEKKRAEEEKERADDEKKRAEKNLDEAEKQKDRAENEKKNAEKQEQIARKNAKEALDQKQRAESLAEENKKKAESELIALTKEKEALERLDSERQLNKLNLDGLFSFENYDYDDAVDIFNQLKTANNIDAFKGKVSSEDKVKNEWWANYNLARTYQQKVDFEMTEKSFEAALLTLSTAEQGLVTKIDPKQFQHVYFFTASYKQAPVSVSKTEIENYKIITLRKFAQFYRICANMPEKCFKNYKDEDEENTVETDSTDIPPAEDDEAVSSLTRSLNQSAVGRYIELLKISKVNSPQSPKDKLYKATVQKELADIYRDLSEFTLAKRNYEEALAYFESDEERSLETIELMKNLMRSTLHQAYQEKALDSLTAADKLSSKILDKVEGLLPNKERNSVEVLYNENIGKTYGEIGELYRVVNELEFIFESKVSKLEERSRTDNKVKEVLEQLEQVLKREDFDAEPPDKFTPEQKELWREIFAEFKIIDTLRKKSRTFSNIGLRIGAFYAKDAYSSQFERFKLLAMAYVENNECGKAVTLIPKMDAEIDSKQPNPPNQKPEIPQLPQLTNLASFAGFYDETLHDTNAASGKYNEWIKTFKEAIADNAELSEAEKFAQGKNYANFYIDIGKFYYIHGKYKEAQAMFDEYHKYVVKNEAYLGKVLDGAEWSQAKTSLKRIYLDILSARMSELSGNTDAAALEYDKMLVRVRDWANTQKELEKANASKLPSNTNNANRITSPNGNANVNNVNTTVNSNVSANVNRWTNVNVNANRLASSTYYTPYNLSLLYKEAGFYETYLLIRIEDLKINKSGGNITGAKDLLKDKTIILPNVDYGSIPSFIIEGYVSGLRNLADKQSDNDVKSRYYRYAMDALENLRYSLSYGYKSEKYTHHRVLSKEYYTDYVEVLTALEQVTLTPIPALAGKIEDAKKSRDRALTFNELENEVPCNDDQLLNRQIKLDLLEKK